MKRIKKRMVLVCVGILLVFSGCQNEKTEEQVATENTANDTVEFEHVEEVLQETTIKVYYGDDNAEKIISSEVVREGLTVSDIMEELADKSIVSADTKVLSLMQGKMDGQRVLKLDLSKEFREYVSMMGTAGEYIIIGSVVDTFLEAFDAEKILITIEGETLETPHQLYENYLMFYPAQ